jgi:hypothetical protein
LGNFKTGVNTAVWRFVDEPSVSINV